MQADAILKKAVEEFEARKPYYDDGDERAMYKAIEMFKILRHNNDKPLTERDGCQLMVLLKMARAENGGFKIDNYIDQSAWSALAGEAADRDNSANLNDTSNCQ